MATVLVADDEDLVRGTIRIILEKAGHTVLLARDGRMAVEMARKQPPQLVICDIIMPEQEGIQTILELRRMLPDVKIVAISGGGRTHNFDYLTMAERIGVAKTLRKPFSRAALLDAVGDCLV